MNWKHQRCGIAVPLQYWRVEGGRGHLGPRSFRQHFNLNCNPNTGFDRKAKCWMQSGKRSFTQEWRTVSSNINWREMPVKNFRQKKKLGQARHILSDWNTSTTPHYIYCQFSCIILIEVRVGHSNLNENRAKYFTSENCTTCTVTFPAENRVGTWSLRFAKSNVYKLFLKPRYS